MRVSLVVLAVLAAAACKKATPPEPLVAQPTPAPVVTQAVPPVVAPEPAMPVRFETAYFDFDSSALRPEAKAALAQGAIVLREYPALRVTLEGHCDERGTTEYNLALGGRRAAAAEQYLIGEGIAPSRLTTVSYGEERPVALGHDETSWALNRRVEFHVPGGPEPMAVAP